MPSLEDASLCLVTFTHQGPVSPLPILPSFALLPASELHHGIAMNCGSCMSRVCPWYPPAGSVSALPVRNLLASYLMSLGEISGGFRAMAMRYSQQVCEQSAH